MSSSSRDFVHMMRFVELSVSSQISVMQLGTTRMVEFSGACGTCAANPEVVQHEPM